MQITGTRGQQIRDFTYDASGTIASGSAAQLIVPEHKSRSFFLFENISDTDMYLGIGGALATASLTNGVVSSISVTNAGFGYTRVPSVHFLGGGNDAWDMVNPSLLSPGQPTWPAPAHPASAHAVLSGNTVGSIVIDDGGVNYKNAPFVFLQNSIYDPFGCFTPGATTAGSILIKAGGGSYTNNGLACTTDAISVFCASSSKAYTFKFMI